ncbi:NAD(P)H-binding protein [Leptolyngbya sp. NIES-2104]|uniref:NAD(P)H-binding protein n=1 Tax=Leptolyngbya sp. NIES-2104 TaxID=1552121 RepID=UPI0006ECB20E|nr:NAD(P)H-binding protein [Leptolyngbya sp. NIES-2104]GAP94832.1 conserved protein YesF [Leptolyngbya sp. NIES-2104]
MIIPPSDSASYAVFYNLLQRIAMIFVTGASGNVGAAVVERLRDRQIPFRVGLRNLERAQQTGGEAVRFDFLDARTYRTAVQGCDAVFLLRPPAIADTRKTLNPFLEVARQEGVRQVVFVSVAGAADNRIVPHYGVEQHLMQNPGGWTILRPGFFAQNLGGAYRTDIVENDRLFVPAGQGLVAFIDGRDIAEVAVKALLEPDAHTGQSYTLTGSEAMSFDQVAALLSEELDRTIVYKPASIPGYGFHLLRRRMPIAQIAIQTILHVGLRYGQAEAVDDTLPKLLGHPPHSMRDYLHDFRSLWLRSSH